MYPEVDFAAGACLIGAGVLIVISLISMAAVVGLRKDPPGTEYPTDKKPYYEGYTANYL